MKDPAFLFYSSDFLTGVAGLTMEERGQYITLLCLQHQHGHLSSKTICLSLGCRSVDEVKDVISKFHQDEQGLYYQHRLEEEIDKRQKYTDSRRLNGIKGGRPKTIVDNHMDNHMDSTCEPYGKPTNNHTENENRNEDLVPAKTKVQPKKPVKNASATKREIIYPDDFENWWRDYPLKLNKADSFRQWVAIEESGEDMYNVFIGTKHYISWFSNKKDYDPQYWKRPNNFLKDEIYKEFMNGIPETLAVKDPSQGKKFVDFGEVT